VRKPEGKTFPDNPSHYALATISRSLLFDGSIMMFKAQGSQGIN
jgi:hypothetical protein